MLKFGSLCRSNTSCLALSACLQSTSAWLLCPRLRLLKEFEPKAVRQRHASCLQVAGLSFPHIATSADIAWMARRSLV